MNYGTLSQNKFASAKAVIIFQVLSCSACDGFAALSHDGNFVANVYVSVLFFIIQTASILAHRIAVCSQVFAYRQKGKKSPPPARSDHTGLMVDTRPSRDMT